jgi:hypothetical protein
VNVEEMSAGRYLPEGLVEGCRLTRNMPKDAVITYDDVVLPAGRLADRLRGEQYRKFRGETWLNDLLAASRPIDQTERHAVAASADNRSDWPASLSREAPSDRLVGGDAGLPPGPV